MIDPIASAPTTTMIESPERAFSHILYNNAKLKRMQEIS